MKKKLILEKIIAALAASLRALQKAAQASHAEATHESSKAENKYDTRGLEAAYLAGGQARQAKELLDALNLYEALELRTFPANEPIDLSALVHLEMDGAESWFFIGPRSGGLEVEYQGKEITVLTPPSPLGGQLMGRKAGQRWSAGVGGATRKYRILAVT